MDSKEGPSPSSAGGQRLDWLASSFDLLADRLPAVCQPGTSQLATGLGHYQCTTGPLAHWGAGLGQ